MPIHNGTMIACDARITPWVLGEDALDRLEAALWRCNIPYVVQGTAGNNRSISVPRSFRARLPMNVQTEMARIVREHKYGGVKQKEVPA